jgi:hypothetical protein
MLTYDDISDFTDLILLQYAYAEEDEVQNLKALLDDLFVFKADDVYALLRRFHQIVSDPEVWAAWRDEQRHDCEGIQTAFGADIEILAHWRERDELR